MSKRFYLCNLIPLWKIDLAHLEVDWTQEEARDGEVVEMRAVVKIPLNLQQPNFSVQFEINESDYLLFGGLDDHVVTIGSQPGDGVEHRPLMALGEADPAPVSRWLQHIFVSPMSIQNSRPWILVRAYWLAQWRDDVAGKPEYYFDFKLIDVASVEHIERSDRELTVSAESVIMHSKTFPGTTRAPDRQGVEFEAVMILSFNETPKFDGRWLYETLHTNDWREFRRVRRCRGCEAFTVGFPIDEIPWDEDRHKIREKNPFVWLTMRSDDFEPRSETRGEEIRIDRQRRQTFGTDLFDDIYFDTFDFICLDNNISIRARKRWGRWRISDPIVLRRLSIAVKVTQLIGRETGLKQDEKIDDRSGGDPEQFEKRFLASIITDVQSGFKRWTSEGTSRNRQPIASLREAYRTLAARSVLPKIGRYEAVLALEPKVFLRQIRSRYHLSEARWDHILNFYHLGSARLTKIKSQADPTISEVKTFFNKVNNLLNHSLIVEKAQEALKKLDPDTEVTIASIATLLPDKSSVAPDLITFQKMEIVARTISDLYHELATDLVVIQSFMTTPSDDSIGAKRFRHWQRSKAVGAFSRALLYHTTFNRFAEIHADILKQSTPDFRADLDAYNRFGEEQRQDGDQMFKDFKPLDEDGFRAIGDQLLVENLKIWKRQIEAAGSAALGLWFAKARFFYIPSFEDQERLQIGDFIIDTFDLTGMFTLDAWGDTAVADWDNSSEPDKPDIDKLFHATLVNEVQIELSLEKPYVDQIAGLLFMLWVAERKPELAPNQSTAEFRVVFDRLREQPDEELQKTIDKLNEFFLDENFTLEQPTLTEFKEIEPENQTLRPLTVRTFKAIDRARISVIIRYPAASIVENLKINLAGAVFVFGQYRQMLTEIARLKRDRVLQVLRDTDGPPDMEWGNSEMSKGETALTRLRGLATTQ